MLGYAAAGAALLLICVTMLTEFRGRTPMRRAMEAQSQRNMIAENTHRGAEVARAMGMVPALAGLWREAHTQHLRAQRQANYVVSGLSVVAKMLRMLVQSCVLALGAYLAIKGEISAGTIIATSILSSRALAPLDQAIASWKGFIAARQGATRLRRLLDGGGKTAPEVQLPVPAERLTVESLFLGAPGMTKPIARNIDFTLTAGQALGIIGSSASGKSTLARGLVGIWPPLAGKVLIDGANIQHWDQARLGPHIGYLPQDIQLFDGSVAENIARFQRPLNSKAIIAAARAAGFHEHILALPDGYDTRIGRGQMELSAGQKQRLGLARALYGDPFLVVLDEPNSNLDAEGEAALTAAITGVAARGGIAVVIAHRPSALAAVGLLAVMRAGEIVAFGPRDEVLAKTVANPDIARKAGGDMFRVVPQKVAG
jgi:PrtD family type I secretion system ABC transporter